MIKFLKRRREKQAEHARRDYLKREQSWWEFQLDLDFLHGKISYDDMVAARQGIHAGEEYIGWARRRT